jgi:hypothetical protein
MPKGEMRVHPRELAAFTECTATGPVCLVPVPMNPLAHAKDTAFGATPRILPCSAVVL